MARKKIKEITNANEAAANSLPTEEKKEVKAEEAQEEEAIIEKPAEGLAVELGEVKEIEEVIVEEVKKKDAFEKESWKPKTSFGIKVKKGEISSIDYALDQRIKILEPEITDA